MNRRVSNVIPSNFESLTVKKLNVAHLSVSKGHNLSGQVEVGNFGDIVRRLDELEAENKVLRDKVANLKLEDLKNVDVTKYEREDGAFLGWVEEDGGKWVPFREGGT